MGPCSRRREGESSQLEWSHPCQQGAESAWQEQVCSKAEEREAGKTIEDVKQEASGQSCSQVEKVNELGHLVCCRGDQEQVKGKAEDPILSRMTSLMPELSLHHCHASASLQNKVLVEL